jgi:hypothetical protein
MKKQRLAAIKADHLESLASHLEAEAARARREAAYARAAIKAAQKRQNWRRVPKLVLTGLDQGMPLSDALSLASAATDCPLDTARAIWENARRSNLAVQRWQRDREVMRLAMIMTNAEIGKARSVVALNRGKPLHPQTVSRIIRARLATSGALYRARYKKGGP